MTDRKDNGDDDKDKTKDSTGEWEFSKLAPSPKETASVDLPAVPNKKIRTFKKQSLVLNTGAVPRTKTRSAMALEMNGEAEIEMGDVFNCAPLYKRAIAFIIDSLFLVGLYHLVELIAPLWLQLIHYFLDSYKLQLLIPEALVIKGILLVSGFTALFFLVVIPVAFFNHSLGKKILGLKVRGEDKYSISIMTAFSRELIMKPISLLILAGLVTPFFTKKKLSIHDMITHTFVVED